jgi:hypothetical protein
MKGLSRPPGAMAPAPAYRSKKNSKKKNAQ